MRTTAARPKPKPAKVWHAYRSANAPKLDEAFIAEHLALVKRVVGRMRMTLPETLDFDELHSVGLAGLMTAVRKYDPSQSDTFQAFAMAHIRGAILDELRRIDVLSRGSREKAKQLQEKIMAIEQELGRPATEEDISAALGMSPEAYGRLLDELRPTSFLPLDCAVYSEDSDDIALHEIIRDEDQLSAEVQLEKKELVALVLQRLQQLPDGPKKIMAMYYFEDMRLAEIAAAFGVTEGRISQIHTQTVISLRAFLRRILAGPLQPQPCS